jgi:hypothetical protein
MGARPPKGTGPSGACASIDDGSGARASIVGAPGAGASSSSAPIRGSAALPSVVPAGCADGSCCGHDPLAGAASYPDADATSSMVTSAPARSAS